MTPATTNALPALAGRRSARVVARSLFALTKPRLAVYSHICLPTADARDLLAATRKTYSGPLEVGEDLMVIDVGETVRARRPVHPSP